MEKWILEVTPLHHLLLMLAFPLFSHLKTDKARASGHHWIHWRFILIFNIFFSFIPACLNTINLNTIYESCNHNFKNWKWFGSQSQGCGGKKNTIDLWAPKSSKCCIVNKGSRNSETCQKEWRRTKKKRTKETTSIEGKG